jgi:glyoxylase-like metal-dependent hydrolase (beta-lactamase superfamily II)
VALGGTHPEQSGVKWLEVVSSYAIDDGDCLLLFDPLALPSEIEVLAAGRETAIVLTCPWHRRDALSLAERLGAPIYVPPPDEGDPQPVDGQVFGAGDRLPVGVETFPGMEPNDLMLWVESSRALAAGDTLVDRGNGLEFRADWASQGAIAERACRLSRSSKGCARCSSCRSSSCSQRMAGRPTAPPSSARSAERLTTARELGRRGNLDRALSAPHTGVNRSEGTG